MYLSQLFIAVVWFWLIKFEEFAMIIIVVILVLNFIVWNQEAATDV